MKTVDELMKEFGEVHPIFDHFGLFTDNRERATEFLMSIPGAKITVTRDCDFPVENVLIGTPMSIRIHQDDFSDLITDRTFHRCSHDSHGKCVSVP